MNRKPTRRAKHTRMHPNREARSSMPGRTFRACEFVFRCRTFREAHAEALAHGVRIADCRGRPWHWKTVITVGRFRPAAVKRLVNGSEPGPDRPPAQTKPAAHTALEWIEAEHETKPNPSHEMQLVKATQMIEFKRLMSRFATLLGPLVAGLALASSPLKSDAATVLTGIDQAGNNIVTSTKLDYQLINDDIGATYNSATLDLSPILSYVVDSIVANNPNYNSNTEVYNNMTFNLTSAGNVSAGWSSNFDKNTGLVSITNTGGRDYTEWTSDSNQNTLTGTLNLANMLDYNGNGIIDPNETLAFMGIANNAFNAYSETGLTNWNTDAQGIGVIPEPSTALIGGLSMLALLKRNREPSPGL